MLFQESYLVSLAKNNDSQVLNYRFITFTSTGPTIVDVSAVDIKTFIFDRSLGLLVQEYQPVYFLKIRRTVGTGESYTYSPLSHPGTGYLVPEDCEINVVRDETTNGFEVWIDGRLQFNWKPAADLSAEKEAPLSDYSGNVVQFKRKD